MNDNTPQAAAERDGAVLNAAIDAECKRINGGKPKDLTLVPMVFPLTPGGIPKPKVPIAIIQYWCKYGEGNNGHWAVEAMFTEDELNHSVLAFRDDYNTPHRVIRLFNAPANGPRTHDDPDDREPHGPADRSCEAGHEPPDL